MLLKKSTVVLIALLPIITNAQKGDHTWSVVLSSGFSNTYSGTIENVMDSTNRFIYGEQKEFYYLKPGIRMGREKHFLAVTLLELKFGTRFLSGFNNLTSTRHYSRLGLDLSFNHMLASLKRFQFFVGESFGFRYRKDDGLPIFYKIVDRLDYKLNFRGVLRAKYELSKKISVEISSLFQIVERQLFKEEWLEPLIPILPNVYQYRDVNYFNGTHFQLNFEYRF